jgi:hypothetical protein
MYTSILITVAAASLPCSPIGLVEWAERHGIKRVILATLDAHGVYAKAGFQPVGHPERWMKIDTRPPFG